jgi:xanthine dehydrogenase small subunit
MGDEIRFLLDDRLQHVGGVDPTLTLLQWLRSNPDRIGSKEGCAEGDCGACTVLVGSLKGDDDRLVWRAINACILFLPMLDGCALLTVESLAGAGALHPLQQALVDLHGAQCGFCTPGFVMSLYGRAIGAAGTESEPITDVLAGNLCRCTGYGPILAAAERVPVNGRADRATRQKLLGLRRAAPLALAYDDPDTGRQRRWFAPANSDQLAEMLLESQDAVLVAGATDVGLWVTKQLQLLETVIHLGAIRELQSLVLSDAGLTIGAAVRYNDARAALATLHTDLGELVRRIGAVQVRNAGTIGGNIANGSPIGDMPPALMALGASLTLRRGTRRRTLPLEDFFLDYRRQDRQRGEFVESLFIPKPHPDQLIRIVKLSKRFDSDISALCGAFALTIENGIITAARIAFGGMAATPRRATHCEAALTGAIWADSSLDRAAVALTNDFTPLSDLRGSASYRLHAAGNLLRRLWHEHQGYAGVLAVEAIDA